MINFINAYLGQPQEQNPVYKKTFGYAGEYAINGSADRTYLTWAARQEAHSATTKILKDKKFDTAEEFEKAYKNLFEKSYESNGLLKL